MIVLLLMQLCVFLRVFFCVCVRPTKEHHIQGIFNMFKLLFQIKKGHTQCRRLPALRGSGEGLTLSPKPYPHKYAEAGARKLLFQI